MLQAWRRVASREGDLLTSAVLTDIKSKVKDLNLTQTEKAIADFLFDNYDNLAFLTISDFATRSKTSEASVIRFLRRLGFSGYSEFKQVLQGDFIGRNAEALTPGQKYRSENGNLRLSDLANRIVLQAIENLYHTFEQMDSEGTSIKEVSHLLARSNRVYVGGFRGPHCCASYLAQRLNLLRGNVVLLENSTADAIERIADCTEGDCVVVFTFPRYSTIGGSMLEIAKGKGATTVLVTDSVSCPFSRHADHLFSVAVESAGFSNSYVAPMALADALIMSVQKQTAGASEQRLDLIERYLAEHDCY